MPNNFRLTGNVYVSKEGNDTNDGLTPETPKLTVQAGLNLLTVSGRILVIGLGVYKETINFTHSVISGTLSIIADGPVIFEGNDINICTIVANNNSQTLNITGIEIRNYSYLQVGNVASVSIQTHFWTNCIFKNNIYQSGGSSSNVSCIYKNCLFINSIYTFTSISGAGNFIQFVSCILINTRMIAESVANFVQGCTKVVNTYIDNASLIRPTTSIVFSEFNFNNIQGKIVMNTNGAVSGANSNGFAQTFAQHRIDYPTYNLNSISANPLFNDPQNLNFTLQAGSPNIRGANDYISNIGGTEYAVYKSAASTEFTSGATISGLTLRGNNSYTITSSPTAGTIETAPIFLQWPATKPLTKLEWAGVLEFNKSITAGTFGNNNVPDWDTYTTGAGASPDRLTVRMRYSTQQTIPTLSSHWDNGGYWTAGNYELFEVNSKPKVDSNGKGNGDPAYIESTGLGDIVPTWIQLSIKLIDTYNP